MSRPNLRHAGIIFHKRQRDRTLSRWHAITYKEAAGGIKGGIMKWQVKAWLGETYKVEKENGLKAYVYRNSLWARYRLDQKDPGYDVRYKGGTIARIYFDRKGATVKAFGAAAACPEISDLDLVEIALRVNNLRIAADQLN